MKNPRVAVRLLSARLLGAVLCGIPALASAHPGHHHPDETDEFDFVRETFLHSHGSLDYVLGFVAVTAVAVSCLNGKRPVRLLAMALALGSLAALPFV